MYPFVINVNNKKIVFVGGGKIAYSRIVSLLPFKPNITVISPSIDERLIPFIEEKKIQYEKRLFQQTDVENAFIVVAATNDRETNQFVKESCHDNQLYNIVDNPKESNFHFPAMHTNNGITIAVTTGGISPSLAKKLRNEFAEVVDELNEQYLIFLQNVREMLKEKQLGAYKKKDIYQQCLLKKYVYSEKERKKLIEFISKL